MEEVLIKIGYILLAILILLVMITIHEFGHYIAGKLLGFKIDEFSIGFGPKLFSKKRKSGEVFSIRLLPLGGYCAFAGETEEEKILAPEKLKGEKEDVFGIEQSASDNQEPKDEANKAEQGDPNEPQGKNFNDQPPWKRIIVLLAGGVFNLLSAAIFSFIFIVSVGASTANVSYVYANYEPTSEYVCQLEKGDKIIAIDGDKIDFHHTLNKAMEGKKEGDIIAVTVLRDGVEQTFDVLIRLYDPEAKDEDGNPLLDNEGNPVKSLGMGVGLNYDKASVSEAFKYFIPYTAELSWLILGSFGKLITGGVPITQVTGTIGTINEMANLAMQSWTYILLLLPLIAANLGIFNLFPIPALDGAKVVFTVIEWIRGKPINQKVEGMIHFVGLIVLFSLVLILDIIHLVIA